MEEEQKFSGDLLIDLQNDPDLINNFGRNINMKELETLLQEPPKLEMNGEVDFFRNNKRKPDQPPAQQLNPQIRQA